MKEILQALESRIKSPVIGYFTLSILIFNWQETFFLFADKGAAADRISYFVEKTSSASLFWYPSLLAVIYTLAYPWVNLAFLYLCRKPTDLKNNLQASSEHKLLIEKNKLESLRSEYLETAETSIIAQAKRDIEIEQIDNEELKDNVRSSIQNIRTENVAENLRENEIDTSYDDPNELLKLADSYRARSIDANYPVDRDKWAKRAGEIEDKAHQMVTKRIKA
jgi:hypothetical protein